MRVCPVWNSVAVDCIALSKESPTMEYKGFQSGTMSSMTHGQATSPSWWDTVHIMYKTPRRLKKDQAQLSKSKLLCDRKNLKVEMAGEWSNLGTTKCIYARLRDKIALYTTKQYLACRRTQIKINMKSLGTTCEIANQSLSVHIESSFNGAKIYIAASF